MDVSEQKDDDMIKGTRARVLAETTWGTGGTHAYRTNRKGAFYYSCSGHGGYIVDGNALTVTERANIDKYHTPEIVWAIRNNLTNEVRKTSNPFSIKRFFARHYPHAEYLDKNYPIYYFEEDCDWAILEKFTDIRAKGRNITEEENAAIVEKTFIKWAMPKAA